MTKGRLFTIGEVAQQIGVARWRLAYWIERGAVGGPALSVPGRRLFTTDDVARLRTEIRAGVTVAATRELGGAKK